MYLLDDVLAAVDAPVAAELWERAICGDLLRGKTRLIVTHSRRFAAAADTLLRLEGGRIAYLGPPEDDPYGLQLWTPGIQPDTEVWSASHLRSHPACVVLVRYSIAACPGGLEVMESAQMQSGQEVGRQGMQLWAVTMDFPERLVLLEGLMQK